MTEKEKLGIWGLTAIVFGSVIGSSIFNIAQNMARAAALGPVILAWLITAVGVYFLVLVFKHLADARPDLNAGIYQYAQVGYGNYVGFNMAWGYWLCVILGNVTYIVMLNDSLGAFFPVLQSHSWHMVLFGTVFVWLMFLLVSKGVKSASLVNNILAVIKFGCLLLIIGVLVVCARVGFFTYDFWGQQSLPPLGTVGDQFSSCMLVTVWSFLGIEGAVMMSARARRPSDVGRATRRGFLLALALYMLVTVLCFGVMRQPQLATLPNPSLAYVLDACAGPWAKWFVIVSVIVSLTGGFIAWTLVCAQTPNQAAAVKILPRQFLHLNSHGMPTYGMIVASCVITLCLILVKTAENVYLAALNLTTLMVLPPYLMSACYFWKLSGKRYTGRVVIVRHRAIAVMAVAFCLYTLWAGGLKLFMVTSLFYIAGTPFFVMARKQHGAPGPMWSLRGVFTRPERWIFAAVCLAAAVSLYLIVTGRVRLDS